MQTLYTLTIILLISSFSLTLNQKANLSQSTNGSLKYYHRYELNHGSVTPNPNIPLQQHYSNERGVRKEAYRLQDEIHKTARKASFKVRNMSRNELALKNKRDLLESRRSATDKVADQREQSIKEEINHDEKFKEIYARRLQENRSKAEHDLPDQRAADENLISFDQQRIKHFKKAEEDQQNELVKTRESDNTERANIDAAIASLEGRINQLQVMIKNVETQSEFKIAQLEHKEEGLQRQVNQDSNLDNQRANNETTEAADASRK